MPNEELFGMLDGVRDAGLRLRLTVCCPGDERAMAKPEAQRLKAAIEEWSASLLGLIITQAPGDLAWIEKLAGAGASQHVAGEGGKLPWPRGLCPGCGLAVLTWETQPRCPHCGFTGFGTP